MRGPIFAILIFLLGLSILSMLVWSLWWVPTVVFLLLLALGLRDITQKRHAILRNFPVIGHFRYLLESIRPEIQQYFIEMDKDGVPFNRERRSVVYQRAKGALDTVPFGTVLDVYSQGYEWIAHSINPVAGHQEPPRVMIGAETCKQPYSASLLNISAMSYGSLSSNAVLALNAGAKEGSFAHNTGEGGVSPYHLEHGGDLIWQIGTGYFGCRSEDGTFDRDKFAKTVKPPEIKMIEVKLSQGAKPGHGGILPASKVTEEISKIRGVPMGKDVLSPPGHTAFDSPPSLLTWIEELRRLSEGKPVGIKLCIGRPEEFMSLCMAMRSAGRHPDFIAIDGGEGGTGAAPLEFSNSVGMPLNEGLVFAHNCLVGFGLRERVKLIASGKIVSAFDMAAKFALGADLCTSARAMMLAIGCIQARRCNSNDCPAGVATQEPGLAQGLDVEDKAKRTASYHRETLDSLMELLGAAGLKHPGEISPHLIMRRVGSTQVQSYFDIYPFIERGALISDPVPAAYEDAWQRARSTHFGAAAKAQP